MLRPILSLATKELIMKKIEPTFCEFTNAFQNNQTGEMFVPASDGSGRLLPTGYFFELLTQRQPAVDNMEGPRDQVVRLAPWAYARADTAAQMLSKLYDVFPENVNLTLQTADDNTQFPLSHKQWQIRLKQDGKAARINAGLLASNIARTTDEWGRQTERPALEAARDELLREINKLKED